ncbi:MAG: ATPase [Rhodobacteraceae bacterium]|nr:ATPase [Paracoccaceae bacterium]
MDGRADQSLIGIDGGGTRCRFALSHGGRVFEAVGAPANATTDLGATIASLLSGITYLAAQAGLDVADLAPARGYLGLAGVLGDDQVAAITAALPMRSIRVEDDRRAAVVGALGTRDGIVAGIGTGSFLAQQMDEQIRFLGGWGAKLGDEASGAYLGRSALARVLHVVDGLEDPSGLTEALLDGFKNDPAKLVTFANTATPQQYAAFAPQVADAAQAGDPNGIALMQGGAGYIVRSCQALDWSAGTPLCLIGGLASRYAAYLPDQMVADLCDPAGRALDGALTLAARIEET